MAVIPYYLLGGRPPVSPLQSRKSTPTNIPARRRKRRSSSSSALSAGSLTPARSDSGLIIGLSQSIGAARDFEGVGGWRLGEQSDDETLWTNINSRLELPADHGRRHKRSLTSGSMPTGDLRDRNPSPEMNTSRARTPPALGMVDGYFPQANPRLLKKTFSAGSASSSKSSNHLVMKQR